MSQRVARPVARYRPGQAPAAAQDVDSSDEETVPSSKPVERVRLPSRVTSAPKVAAAVPVAPTAPRPAAAPVDMDEYETDSEEDVKPTRPGPSTHTPPARTQPPPPRPLNKQALPPAAVQLHAPPIQDASSSSEYDSESEDESEDEAPAPLLKPVFVSKRDRAAPKPEHVETTKRSAEALQAEKKAAHDLAAERVVRALKEKQHDEETMEIDDTDGLDPDAEFAAWRVRELARLERVRQAERARQLEEEEVARRRALPEDVRLREDMAHARQTRAEKQRGQQGFMQKYYHKGAFFQDMDILQRDYSQSTGDAVDKSQLPQIMQKRSFGKRSQSKWTHLAAEDTTKQGLPDLRTQGATRRT